MLGAYPEFLREGRASRPYLHPLSLLAAGTTRKGQAPPVEGRTSPKGTVLGKEDEELGRRGVSVIGGRIRNAARVEERSEQRARLRQREAGEEALELTGTDFAVPRPLAHEHAHLRSAQARVPLNVGFDVHLKHQHGPNIPRYSSRYDDEH